MTSKVSRWLFFGAWRKVFVVVGLIYLSLSRDIDLRCTTIKS